ncbi:unnamed protein product [Rhizoctonia solani]|uniref:T6SS Phospholipase effector Tle1-like catalytic domain-containing protein n=1 Tax=Rhizoctonia solani TaxID=456999 RepID=A0A8H3H4Z3_9AGAM|nr:unnamed protein product [Rhizoctonia solani]
MAPSAERPFNPLKSHELYTLRMLERGSTEPVFVRATPIEGSGCVIENEEDAKFNLSDHIGINSHKNNTLEWGLSGFEADTENITVGRIEAFGPQRHLSVQLKGTEKTRTLNLDEYLGLVEYYDDATGEIRTKLERKPETSKRSIILCFDGTSNHFSNQNTNVVKLVELLKKDDPSKQMVYYQAGVGTYSAPGFMTDAGQQIASTADQAVAWYLYQHVIDGYRYLMQTYRAGDQISIFGFSRGAYTARALAGMLYSVGLLPRHNLEQVSFAYQVYAESKFTGEEPGSSGPVEFTASPKDIHPGAFKRAFCIPITITFLGVWDTVGSLGALRRKTLPYIEHNPGVQQALALDENRGNFIPSVWDHSKNIRGQNTLEVWFKGGHCDVGGGAEPAEPYIRDGDVTPTRQKRLSNIPLRWMVRQCFTPGIHILFDPKAMRRYRNYEILEKRQPGGSTTAHLKASADLDEQDVTEAPFIAQDKWSSTGWGWWILDKIPVPKMSQINAPGTQPGTDWMPNNGAARTINNPVDTDHIRLHSSVYTHLKKYPNEGGKGGKGYVPAAIWHNWKENKWPLIDEGDMPSTMSLKDGHSGPVREALVMSWKVAKAKPEQGWTGKLTSWIGWS